MHCRMEMRKARGEGTRLTVDSEAGAADRGRQADQQRQEAQSNEERADLRADHGAGSSAAPT